MKLYMGIDPGQDGGIGIIDENKNIMFLMAYPNTVIFAALKEAYKKGGTPLGITTCLEEVHAMPKQGVSSTFTFGRFFGQLEGILMCEGIPYQLKSPQAWKEEFGLNSDKKKSIEVCKNLFPSANLLATEKCQKEHDGMAEALLMAEYARRKL